VTLQPLERFPLDAGDHLLGHFYGADAMGSAWAREGEGRGFERPLRDESAIRALARRTSPGCATFRRDRGVPQGARRGACRSWLLRQPFHARCYMWKAAGSDDWRTAQALSHSRRSSCTGLRGHARVGNGVPERADRSRRRSSDDLRYLGRRLAHDDYESFSLGYSRKSRGLTKQRDGARVPRSVPKGGNPGCAKFSRQRCDAAGLDWTAIRAQRENWPAGRVALQEIWIPPRSLRRRRSARSSAHVLDAYAPRRHIFQFGHGILHQTPIDSLLH